jgi:hypothetical protein
LRRRGRAKGRRQNQKSPRSRDRIARPKTHLEPRTKIKTMKPCSTLDDARGCLSRGVRKNRAAESDAKRARRFTSDETPPFFPRAKYSYEKRKKETGLDWPISEKRL